MCASLFMRPTDWWDASLFLEAPRCYFFFGHRTFLSITAKSQWSLESWSSKEGGVSGSVGVEVLRRDRVRTRCQGESVSDRAIIWRHRCGLWFSAASLAESSSKYSHLCASWFLDFLPNVAVLHDPGTVRNAGFLQQFLKVLLFLFLPHVTFLFSGRRRRRMCLRTCVCVCVCA